MDVDDEEEHKELSISMQEYNRQQNIFIIIFTIIKI